MIGARPDRIDPVRGNARWDQDDGFEGERFLCCYTGRDVSKVNGIEGAAQNPERHRRFLAFSGFRALALGAC